jgi:hypothetical protein
MNVALHIERLVLDGLPVHSGQAPEVQAALETELTRLLKEQGLAGVAGGAMPHLAVAPIQLSRDGPPGHWGRQIARTLYDGLAPAPAAPANRRLTGNLAR